MGCDPRDEKKAQSLFLASLFGAAIGTAPCFALASTLTTISSFPAKKDSLEAPTGTLTRYGNALFGTAAYGGSVGLGGVFKAYIGTGKERAVYNFSGTPDGANPFAPLTQLGGLLYGTTANGGTVKGGTIYAFDPVTSQLTVVYNFTNYADPLSAMVPYGSKFVGTTAFGGKGGSGQLYQFDPASKKVKVLYSFGKSNKGRDAGGPPLLVGTKFYGVTIYGGDDDNGTLYEYDTVTGHQTTLYSFTENVGYEPSGNLVKAGNGLFGVTSAYPQYGAIYRYDLKTKTASVFYDFSGKAGDGTSPDPTLIYTNGLIYGETSAGGAGNLGTIYTIDPITGAESVLYSFSGGADGGGPIGGLLASHGVFYGTTTTGGAHGKGTVFSFVP